jgi:hypothetical protein
VFARVRGRLFPDVNPSVTITGGVADCGEID